MKVNHDCEKIYGILLQSYTLMFMNAVVFTAFKFVAVQIVLPWLLPIVFHKDQNETQRAHESAIAEAQPSNNLQDEISVDVEMDETSSTAPTGAKYEFQKTLDEVGLSMKNAYRKAIKEYSVKDEEIKGRLAIDVVFVQFQAIYALISFVISCVSVDQSLTSWDQYQHFYGLVLNSGVSTLLISFVLFVYGHREISEAQRSRYAAHNFKHVEATSAELRTVFRSCGFFVLLILPPSYTHIFPAYFVYLWVLVIVIMSVSLFEVCIKPPLHSVSANQMPLWVRKMGTEILIRLLILAVLQTGFNYMFLFYEAAKDGMSGDEYTGVIVREYTLRTQTYCQYETATSSLANAIVFFAWL